MKFLGSNRQWATHFLNLLIIKYSNNKMDQKQYKHTIFNSGCDQINTPNYD